jgi:hypothetical protein
MLSELRQNLAATVEQEYADFIRQGYKKTVIYQYMAKKYFVSADWMRKHCNLKQYDYESGANFNPTK